MTRINDRTRNARDRVPRPSESRTVTFIAGVVATAFASGFTHAQCIEDILLSPLHPQANEFGTEVASASASGFDVMAVTDPVHEELYLYHQAIDGAWNLAATRSGEGDDEGFGTALAASGDFGFTCIEDGRYTVVVGAPRSDIWADNGGAAYFVQYQCLGAGGNCNGLHVCGVGSLEAIYNDTIAPWDEFGASVAVGLRGIGVGAPGTGTDGSVYLHPSGVSIDGSTAPGHGGRFGKVVAMDGDWLFVAANGPLMIDAPDRIFIYEYAAGVFSPHAGTPWFDLPTGYRAVEISVDQDVAMIGASSNHSSDHVFETRVVGGVWTVPQIVASGGARVDLDGDILVTGTAPDGASMPVCSFPGSRARLYEPHGGMWSLNTCQDFSHNTAFDTPVASAGGHIIVGSAFETAEWCGPVPNCSICTTPVPTGAVYVYDPTCPGTAVPANDDCVDAIVLDHDTGQAFNTECALTDGPSDCLIEKDMWFTYTPPCSGPAEVVIDAGFDVAVAIYEDACPPGNAIVCASGVGGVTAAFEGAASTPVLIRVGGFDAFGGSGTITLRNALTNDTCADATALVVDEANTTQVLDFSLEGATPDGPAHPGCIGASDGDLWYRVTAGTGGILTVSTCRITGLDTRLALYDGAACPVGAADLIACVNDTAGCGDGELLEAAVVSGQEYLVRLAGVAGTSNCGTLTIELTPLDSCPACGGSDNDNFALTGGIVGSPNGSDWTWQITSPSTPIQFAPSPVITTNGVTPGDPPDDLNNDGVWNVDDVALRFAESINTHFTSIGCDTDLGTYDIHASAVNVFGTTYLSLVAKCQIELWVDGCLVNGPDPCPFNPTIEYVPLPGTDCNANGLDDAIDLFLGTSVDENENAIPDECECAADLDGSDDVGFSDVLAIISAWGPCALVCPEDLSGNGAVDFADILAVIAAWGPC